MLSGDNGILQKSTEAKRTTERAEAKEQAQLDILAWITDKTANHEDSSLDNSKIKEILTGKTYVKGGQPGNESFFTAKGEYEIPYTELYNYTKDDEAEGITIKVGTTNLKNVSDLTTLYGETTDYTSVDNVQWQLFYDDEGYIYLIASDYVPGSTLPNELIAGYVERNASFSNTIYDSETNTRSDTGTIMETGEWSKGSESNTFTANATVSHITRNYLKWINSSVVNTTNNSNIKSVAYMMDTSKWSNFAGNTKGAYAIGGPTLEMFVLSYNAKHNENKLGTYETIIDASLDSTNGNANSNGYKSKLQSGSWSDVTEGLDTGNMWILSYNSDTYGYWLSTPGSSYTYSVVTVMEYRHGGTILDNTTNSDNKGFRPLVAIPKSSLK